MFDYKNIEFVNAEGISGKGLLHDVAQDERTEEFEVRGIFYREPVSNKEKCIAVVDGITASELWLLTPRDGLDEDDVLDYLTTSGELFDVGIPDEASERLAGDEDTVLEDFYEIAKESGVPETYLYYIDYDRMLRDEQLSGYMVQGDVTGKWWRTY